MATHNTQTHIILDTNFEKYYSDPDDNSNFAFVVLLNSPATLNAVLQYYRNDLEKHLCTPPTK